MVTHRASLGPLSVLSIIILLVYTEGQRTRNEAEYGQANSIICQSLLKFGIPERYHSNLERF